MSKSDKVTCENIGDKNSGELSEKSERFVGGVAFCNFGSHRVLCSRKRKTNILKI